MNHLGSQLIKQLARDSGGGVFFLDCIPKLSGTYALKLTTFSPGGLDGSHFSSSELLLDDLISTSMNNVLEKYYDDDPIGKMVGHSPFWARFGTARLLRITMRNTQS